MVRQAKWPGFREAFNGFDPEYVAGLSPDDIDRLTNDTRIIRNRRKIESTVYNAGALIEADQGSRGFANYLHTQGGFEDLSNALRKRFKHVGAFGAYYFLYVVGEPVPPHEEFRARLAKTKG